MRKIDPIPDPWPLEKKGPPRPSDAPSLANLFDRAPAPATFNADDLRQIVREELERAAEQRDIVDAFAEFERGPEAAVLRRRWAR